MNLVWFIHTYIYIYRYCAFENRLNIAKQNIVMLTCIDIFLHPYSDGTFSKVDVWHTMQTKFTATLFQCWSSCKKNCPQVHVLVLSVYVDAISACHTLTDRVSVGEHPLVARSICEAKQMRLPTIATVPLWDLAVKLLCTGSGWDPFWTTRVSACQVSDSKDGVSHGYYYIAILWRELRICRLCQSHHPT